MCPPFPRVKAHFLLRAAERGLRADVREFILTFGSEFQAAGVTYLVILVRRLPAELRGSEIARRARGWIVVLGDDQVPMTCYRRFDAAQALRRKPKRRSTPKERRFVEEREERLSRGAEPRYLRAA